MELLRRLVELDAPLALAVKSTVAYMKSGETPPRGLEFGLDYMRSLPTESTEIDDVPLKVVVLCRYDLGMSPGKMAAQVGHSIHSLCRECDEVLLEEWEDELSGSKIVVLGVENLMVLEEICSQAQSFGLGVFKIEDAGRTEVEPGSITVAAIGPCYEPILDVITGSLRPYKEPRLSKKPDFGVGSGL
jgi:PTH2 family peptidyl-tRNA hydrolase